MSGVLRAFTIGFYLLMCFSAVYLNHHYVLDLMWGTTYAILIFVTMRTTEKWRHRGSLGSP
jgi:membrane-associated phospholipid phosphatase